MALDTNESKGYRGSVTYGTPTIVGRVEMVAIMERNKSETLVADIVTYGIITRRTIIADYSTDTPYSSRLGTKSTPDPPTTTRKDSPQDTYDLTTKEKDKKRNLFSKNEG